MPVKTFNKKSELLYDVENLLNKTHTVESSNRGEAGNLFEQLLLGENKPGSQPDVVFKNGKTLEIKSFSDGEKKISICKLSRNTYNCDKLREQYVLNKMNEVLLVHYQEEKINNEFFFRKVEFTHAYNLWDLDCDKLLDLMTTTIRKDKNHEFEISIKPCDLALCYRKYKRIPSKP